MQIFWDLVTNATLWVAAIAWFAASFMKCLIEFAKTKQLKFSAMFTSGGLPSAHSAFVTSLATSIGIYEGFGSPVFAIATVIAIIVMYDAAGVRRAAGRQARIINKVTAKMVENFKEFSDEFGLQLKEMLGHSPLEVFAGALVGVMVAIAEYLIMS